MGGRLRRVAIAGVPAAVLVFVALAPAQENPDDNAIWKAFIGWFRSVPLDADPFAAYAAKLTQEGVPEKEIRRRMVAIVRLSSEHPDGVEVFFDPAFSRPMTGNPGEDGFYQVRRQHPDAEGCLRHL